MPSSFSRFLSEEEMQRVRELHLQSLRDAELETQAGSPEPEDSGSEK